MYTYGVYPGSYWNGVYQPVYSPRVTLPYYYGQDTVQKSAQLQASQPEKSRAVDAESPSAKAALSYLQNTVGLDSCGKQAKIYIESILSGGSPAQAKAKAKSVYIRNYNAGERYEPGSACEASEIAFRKASQNGQDPVLAAALAFMKAHQSDSP